MASFLTKIFGSRNDRLIKQYRRKVAVINKLEPEIKALSDEQLKAKTAEFRQRLADGASLDSLLPEAFAVVREASFRVLGMRHFDVQLIGGMVLNDGKIAEMRTGEGKTLTATLAVYLNALPGKGAHVVTVNDYLASRDAAWMGKVYNFLGMTVGTILSNQPNDQKQAAYAADITYGTNNEYGFDYLRDNMAFSPEERVQRKLHYALVDEVDSILIDEARTPLIISGPAEDSSEMYKRVNKIIPHLIRQEKEDSETFQGEGHFSVDEKSRQVNLTERGLVLIEELLVKEGIMDEGESLYSPANIMLMHHVTAALRAHALFTRDVDYIVKDGEVIIVDEHTGRTMQGRRWSDGLHQAVEAKEGVQIQNENQTLASITFQNYFRLYEKLAGMTGTADTEAFEFSSIYKLDTVVVPTNRPMIRKDLPDLVYMTEAEKIQAIIEDIKERTAKGQPVLVGTISIEKSELVSNELTKAGIKHNVLNAKFHANEAAIVAQAGYPAAVTIATNMAGRGTDIKLTPEVKAAGGLAIIGTERHESRRVDRQLRGRAGRQGDPGSSVFYVSLEDKLMRLFASERIAKVMDRLGFEDGERIESPMISKSIERAQRKVEENNFGIRKHLLEYDDVMNRQRTVIYEKRRHALMGERIGMDIANIIWDRVLNIVNNNDFTGAKEEFLKVLAMEIPFNEDEYENGRREDLAERAFQEAMAAFKRKTDRIQTTAMPIIKQVFENQGAMYERIMVPITDGKRMYNIACNLKEAYDSEAKSVVKEFEKNVVLQMIDDDWKENLRKLDELRHSVQNASYEQKDPLLIFKLESAKIWDGMINDMYDRIASILMRGQIPVMEQEQPVQEAAPEQHTQQNYVESKVDLDAEREAQEAAANQDTRENAEVNRTPYRAERMPRPNDPCPCGSGKKFKNCHGRNLQA